MKLPPYELAARAWGECLEASAMRSAGTGSFDFAGLRFAQALLRSG
jgi:hypothetical protein